MATNAPELYKDTSKPSVWNSIYTVICQLMKKKQLLEIEFEEVKLPPCKHKRCRVYCHLQKCKEWVIPEDVPSNFINFTEHVDLQVNIIAAQMPGDVKSSRTHIFDVLQRFVCLTPSDTTEECLLFWISYIKETCQRQHQCTSKLPCQDTTLLRVVD